MISCIRLGNKHFWKRRAAFNVTLTRSCKVRAGSLTPRHRIPLHFMPVIEGGRERERESGGGGEGERDVADMKRTGSHVAIALHHFMDVRTALWISGPPYGCQNRLMDVRTALWMSGPPHGYQDCFMDIRTTFWMLGPLYGCQDHFWDARTTLWIAGPLLGCQN